MKLALCGLGKAGKRFVDFVTNDTNNELAAVVCREESQTAGKTVTEVTHIKTDEELIIKKISDFKNDEKIDVLVDFSAGDTSLKLVDLCCDKKINLVICPTGLTDEELKTVEKKVNENNIGVVYAPTLTVGINAMIKFVEMFSANYPNFDFEIVEKHGKQKGKPTKTAKIIAESTGREGIEISSVRLDGYVGEHEVIATNGYEKITFAHESFSRDAFANGAIVAANFIQNKTGFYNIKNIFKDF